jgi:preprotein translocase subunit SecF
MAETQHPHKFRHLIAPGSNFAFVSKFRLSVFLSCIAMLIGIGSLFVNKAARGSYMNWTIDFKGGTEIIYDFTAKDTGKYVKADPHTVREALKGAGDVEVSDYSWKTGPNGDVDVYGAMIRTPRYGAVTQAQADKGHDAVMKAFAANKIDRAVWSGDRMFVRSKVPLDEKTATQALASAGLEMKAWGDEAKLYQTADQGTGEYSAVLSVWGLDRQYQRVLEKALPDDTVEVKNAYGVGAKAGSKLRNDAVKSLVYAIFLIMLYLAFRFDIRYAPGAAFATIHDAVMVVSVFSITWTEVSLTSVAALLTVIGYSINDTVIVFDRIRENQAKLKDKKLERIIDISINEMLVRTVLTSMTVFVVTMAMNILGDGMISNFAFAMNIGVIVGTYSSMFLAAPLFLWVSKKWYSAPPSAQRSSRAAAIAAQP